MGNSNTTANAKEDAEKKQNRKLNQELKLSADEETKKIKLLLLGTGESGKSTLFKQMKSLYGKRAVTNPVEARMQRFAVYSTILDSMASLLRGTDRHTPLADESLAKMKEDILIHNEDFSNGESDEGKVIGEDIKDKLIALWNDEGVRDTWENHRSDLQVQQSLEYFMEHAERVLKPEFEVKEEDWLRARLRTTGIMSEEFMVDKVVFNVYDVGGQRNERRKWIHVFSNVTSVIYVCAINEYDEFLFEDNSVNRVEESLDLFDEMVNHDEFVQTGMILFLNKIDLFKEKLLRKPIKFVDRANPMKSRWVDYSGEVCERGVGLDSPEFEASYSDATEYFRQKFLNLNQHPSTKDIYVHLTCATDREKVDVVFSACRDIILRNGLASQGFSFVRD